eukprot:758633-Hanusia_phi.AAC.1
MDVVEEMRGKGDEGRRGRQRTRTRAEWEREGGGGRGRWSSKGGERTDLLLQLDKASFEASRLPANSPYSMFESHMKAGKDFESWRSDFEADLYAVRAPRSSRQPLASD